MSGTPYWAVTSRKPVKKPGLGGSRRWKGSTMTAPNSSWRASMSAVAASKSLNGAISTSSWTDWGMPGESGVGRGKSCGLAGDMLIRA